VILFQSYNSSIKTMHLLNSTRGTDKNFNPTIVRLKPLSPAVIAPPGTKFQSYNSSIKTVTRSMFSFLTYIFQSYNSSIKTYPLAAENIANVFIFQSYNSSIKTKKIFASLITFFLDFNPTIVRLKHFINI